MRALLGGRPTVHADPLGGLVENIGRQMLPEDLDLETATKRLLSALRPGSDAHRRVLNHAAEAAKLHVSAVDPKSPKGAKRVDALLREVDRTSEVLREWADRMERTGQAVVVRSTDPGVNAPQSCCDGCGMPNLLISAVDSAEQSGEPWAIVMTTEEYEQG